MSLPPDTDAGFRLPIEGDWISPDELARAEQAREYLYRRNAKRRRWGPFERMLACVAIVVVICLEVAMIVYIAAQIAARRAS